MSYFFITGLPRTMSAWMSVMFSDEGYRMRCLHEGVNGLSTFSEFHSRLTGLHEKYRHVGDADSALAWFPIRDYFPDAKILIIERDLDEVLDSLRRVIPVTDDVIYALAETQRLLSDMPGERVAYDEVHDRLECIWHYLIGLDIPYPKDLARQLKKMNIQTMDTDYDSELLTSFISDGSTQRQENDDERNIQEGNRPAG